MRFFTTRFFIRPAIFYWVVALTIFCKIYSTYFLNNSFKVNIEICLNSVFLIIFFWDVFYLFFKTYDRLEICDEINRLEALKEESIKYYNKFDQEHLLFNYREALYNIYPKGFFVHFIKTQEEITSKSNNVNFIIILLILFSWQFSIDYFKPIGPIIFLLIIFTSILFCLALILYIVNRNKNLFASTCILSAWAIYFLLTWGKNAYIRSYGDEVLGSFFEKSEYKTKYYVDIYSDINRGKIYRLPAEIHVFSEDEYEDSYDRFGESYTIYTTKYIIVEKVLWPDGGYLRFDNCNIEIGNKILCSDQNGKYWHLELTNKKVP